MERFIVNDLYTGESVRLSYSSPTLILFFSLREVQLMKEISKDITASKLKAISVHIGEEPIKVNVLMQKEEECIPVYKGGHNLKNFSGFGIKEIPWILLISNNSIIFSSKIDEIPKPLVKSILFKFPEFKQTYIEKPKTIDEVIKSDTMTTEGKISLLENITIENQAEIDKLKKELDAKDRLIKDIMRRM